MAKDWSGLPDRCGSYYKEAATTSKLGADMLNVPLELLQDLIDDVADYAVSRTFKDRETTWRSDLLKRADELLARQPAAIDKQDKQPDRDTKQLADWLLIDPQTGEPLHFAGPLERDFLRMSRVKMESKSGDVWTLTAGLKEGYLTSAERMANLEKVAAEEQQAARIAELEHEAGFTKPVDAADSTYPNSLGVAQTLRRCKEDLHTEARFVLWQAARITELEAQLAAVAPAVDAQPVAWRIFDGEGGYDYRDEPPPEVNVAWAAKHGRKYEPLYTEPQSSQSAQSEPVAWANVKDDGTIVGLSQHPEDIANWQNPRPLCYQCKGCGDSEYGPWRCSRCEGSGFESAPNAAQSEGLRKAITEIAEQEHVELMLDPTWAQRIAIAALSQHTGEKDD